MTRLSEGEINAIRRRHVRWPAGIGESIATPISAATSAREFSNATARSARTAASDGDVNSSPIVYTSPRFATFDSNSSRTAVR